MKRFIPLFLLLLGALVLVACGGESEPPALPLAEVDLVATDIAYDKDRIEVMVGQPLKINLQNEGALEHDFSIMEVPHTGEVHAEEMHEESDHDMSHMEMDPDVHVASPIGGSHSVEFTPSEAGEYEFFCTV
ncbi:MAG: hypothetical protein GWP61_24765 [Chloroflexi bacterium]|jgi:uncharacterized cupredoxin-like copper-binding protein|nr:hypothetical protein [Chloroflexota bacterium]